MDGKPVRYEVTVMRHTQKRVCCEPQQTLIKYGLLSNILFGITPHPAARRNQLRPCEP